MSAERRIEIAMNRRERRRSWVRDALSRLTFRGGTQEDDTPESDPLWPPLPISTLRVIGADELIIGCVIRQGGGYFEVGDWRGEKPVRLALTSYSRVQAYFGNDAIAVERER